MTVKQHVFPAGSISRFVGDDRCVSVYIIKKQEEKHFKRDDEVFCRLRAWDQLAESGWMKQIEDKYQILADAVLAGSIHTITEKEEPIITNMYALWNIRADEREDPFDDQKTGAPDVSRHLTKDEEEYLERNHITFVRPDLSIPGRHLLGIQMRLNLFKVAKQMNDARWGILRASDGEFIVPDNFSNARILPLSPTICFSSPSSDAVIGAREVAEINSLAVTSSKWYYFARELSKCPR